MILQQLYRDATAILGESATPSMYDRKPVKWIIPLTYDGKVAPFIPLGERRGELHTVPYLGRAFGIRPILLADKAAYVLGVAPNDRRAADKHTAFKALVRQCAQDTGDPLVRAVDTFLSSWKPDPAQVNQLTGKAEIKDSDILTFTVDGEFPTNRPVVQQFWARVAKPQEETVNTSMQCLVTGRFGPVEDCLPDMIKGVPGGQPSGTALVSVNAAAFESYGLRGGLTSPVSREAAEQFTKALNKLIAGERTRLYVGNLVYVFWTSLGPEEEIPGMIGQPQPQQVRELLNSYRTGKPYRRMDVTAFYALALSGSGGRAVVRDYISTTVKNAYDNLARWFDAHRIVPTEGTKEVYFDEYRLAASLYRDARKEMVARVPRAIMRAALHGDPLPPDLRDQAVLRCRAEQRVTPARAALIKAVFITQINDEQRRKEEAEKMTRLDPDRHDPAYLCGRLLAELERIQRRALGRINTTVTDRFYGAASTTPAAVFGTLLTDANKAHLPKIRKQNPRAYEALQASLAEILAPMQEWPRTLTLEQQAIFALGFYHQRAQNSARAAAAGERNEMDMDTHLTEDD